MNKLEDIMKKFVEDFSGKKVIIEFDNFLRGKIELDNVNIKYDIDDGFFKIENDKNYIEFNSLDIKHIDNNTKLEIELENSQKIIIEKL